MARGDQINLHPHFKGEGPTLPCEGAVGDLYVFTDLDEDIPDPSPFLQGRGQLYFCIKAMDGERSAVWARVAFEGATTCAVPPPPPPHYTELKDH